jgi:hypothetical protein
MDFRWLREYVGFERVRGLWVTFWFQDILRGQYQMLSADPNSLANLDQGQSREP